MQKILTSPWFTDCAEEAVTLYVSIFHHSCIKRIVRHSEAGPEPAGKVMIIDLSRASG